jgi:hypothetical protein
MVIQKTPFEYNISQKELNTDSLYTNAPFVRFIHGLGKYLVSRVKNERLYKEIESLLELVQPVVINDWQERVECWIYEIPDLSEWLAGLIVDSDGKF